MPSVGSDLPATDLDAAIHVLGADCEAVLSGEKLDCSTATVSDELG